MVTLSHFSVYSQELNTTESLPLDSSPRLDTIAKTILKEGIDLFEIMSRSSFAIDIIFHKLDTTGIIGYITYTKDLLPDIQPNVAVQPEHSIITIALTGKKSKPKIKYSISSFYPPQYRLSPTGEQSDDDIELFIDTILRKPDSYQKTLLKILGQIKKDALSDTGFYKYYESTQLNPVFMSHNKNEEFPVYLISTTAKEGIVPLGNDYYFLFDRKGKPLYKEKIHQNLIEISMGSDSLQPEEEEEASFHTHFSHTSAYITPSDICSLLLFKDYVQWRSHIVMSKNYLSFFWLDEMELKIVHRKNEE